MKGKLTMFNKVMYFSVMFLCISLKAVANSASKDDNLKSLITSLQEQVMTLQKEQEQNRLIIQTLEIRLDNQLTRRRKSSRTTSKYSSNSIELKSSSNNDSTTNNITKEQKDSTRRIIRDIIGELTSHEQITEKTLYPHNVEDLLTTQLPITIEHENLEHLSSTDRYDSEEVRELNQLLKELRDDLMSVKEVTRSQETSGYPDLRSEWELLRMEVQKLRQDMESQKSKYEQQREHLAELKSQHVTTRWLQKTVEDIRREISELAAALNISMAIRQSQQLETVLDRVRTDLATLRGEVEHGGAGMIRQAAAVQQLKEELIEVRQMATTILAQHQQLVEEVSLLKDRMLEPEKPVETAELKIPIAEFSETGSSLNVEGSGSEEELTKNQLTKENERHGNQKYLKQDVEKLKDSIHRLQASHSLLNEEMRILRWNYSSSLARVETVQRTTAQLENTTVQWREDHALLSESIDNILIRLTLVEEKAQQNGQNIVNVTEAMSGMDKVHSSTVQLFEALEGLEEEYSQSIGELQKEVSKFEFNVAQVQGGFDILRHDQTSHQDDLRALKLNFATLQQDFRRDHYRLITIQNEVLNKSLQRCAEEGHGALRDLKLANLELQLAKIAKREDDSKQQVNHMYSRLLQKVDKVALSTIETSQKNIFEEIRNISSQLPTMNDGHSNLKNELMKFVRVLPHDCSMKDTPNQALKYMSGVYLIQVPYIKGATEVYCDMNTLNQRWTILQRRMDGSEDFFRGWADYKRGFGDPRGEFWLGNEILHGLTREKNYTLRIDMWDIFERYMYAEYSEFRVLSEEEQYRLEVGQYSGNASDALKHHHNMAFSTHDRDNDVSSTHCAMYYSAGWWYQHCQYVNVNGRYAIGMTWYDSENKDWVQLAKVEMKIRVANDS